jgi:hypothetical protein
MRPISGLAVACAVAAAAVAALPSPPAVRYDPEAVAAVAAMKTAAEALHAYTMVLVKRELFVDELEPEETMTVKWQRPQRIYLKETAGDHAGQEVLYAQGWNKNRIKVHPGTFPWFTLNLDPYGNVAMAHSHHAVPQVSLVQFVDLVADNLDRAQAKDTGRIIVAGRATLWGRPTTVIEMTAPPTGTTPTLEKGETLWDVARATGQDMYVILHANRHRLWRQADHPEKGDAVLVPEFYAGRMVLWIDDELRLPIQADIYDHDGNLYEHYEHRELKVNVGLLDADFSPKNPAYHF